MGKWGLTDEFPAASAACEATSWATPGRWQPFPNNPVLAPGPAGSWDAGALGSMTVLNARTMHKSTHVIQNDGQWEMFFGQDGFFDQAGQDVRLAVFKGNSNDLGGKDEK